MDAVLKIILFTVIAVIIASFIKEQIPEFLPVFIAAAVVIMAAMIFPSLSEIGNYVNRMLGIRETETLVMPVVKVLGITTVVRIVSDMCVDSGEKAIGHMAEIIGTICALLSIMPLIMSLMENVGSII